MLRHIGSLFLEKNLTLLGDSEKKEENHAIRIIFSQIRVFLQIFPFPFYLKE
jgi:hypothetical protein